MPGGAATRCPREGAREAEGQLQCLGGEPHALDGLGILLLLYLHFTDGEMGSEVE